MVSKKRRHTHKTNISNSLNNSRSKKPRRIYRGGAPTPEQEAAATNTAAALVLTEPQPAAEPPRPPTTLPRPPITPQSDADEIKRLRDECKTALEKTQAAARIAQQAAKAAPPQSARQEGAQEDANSAREAATDAQQAATAAQDEYNKITNSLNDEEQIQKILTEIKKQLQIAETKKNEAIIKANTVIKSRLEDITPIEINDRSPIPNYSVEDGKNETIIIKKPTIQATETRIFTKASENIGYHASIFNPNPFGNVKQESIDYRSKYGALQTTNYRFRIYNWENPLVLPFYDDTRQPTIRVNNYFEMTASDRKTPELIVEPITNNIEVHNRLLTIEVTDTMGKLQKYKIGRRRVFTKIGKNDEYSRRFYDEIIIRDANTGKQMIVVLVNYVLLLHQEAFDIL